MNSEAMFDHGAITIGDMAIGAFLGTFSFVGDERERMIKSCKKLWSHVLSECPGVKPFGLYRFDLVPHFANADKSVEGDIGALSIGGVYEINGHAPECIAASSVMRHKLPKVNCFDAVKKVAMYLSKYFGSNTIAFVVGYKSSTKYHWYKYFVNDLIAHGVNVVIMSEREVMLNAPDIVWRWGDARKDGESHYSQEFVDWLFEQDKSIVFNAILEPEKDVSNKKFLLQSTDPFVSELIGKNRSLTEESIWWSVDENSHCNLIVKPDGGASGNDIVFGECHYETTWIDKLRELLTQNVSYSLWETRWLPCVHIAGQRLAIDINPAFWVDGEKIEYLYTIIRVDNYATYRHDRKTINVAKGAGIAGLIE